MLSREVIALNSNTSVAPGPCSTAVDERRSIGCSISRRSRPPARPIAVAATNERTTAIISRLSHYSRRCGAVAASSWSPQTSQFDSGPHSVNTRQTIARHANTLTSSERRVTAVSQVTTVSRTVYQGGETVQVVGRRPRRRRAPGVRQGVWPMMQRDVKVHSLTFVSSFCAGADSKA